MNQVLGHIGLTKTATSSIQKSLKKISYRLDLSGYVYPDRLARETAPLWPLEVVGAKRAPRSMPSPVARASFRLRRFSTALWSRSLRSDLDGVSGTPTWWCISADTTGGWNPPSCGAPGLGESSSILGTTTNRSVSRRLTIQRRSHLGSKCLVTTVSTLGSPSARYPDVESRWASSSER